MKHTLYNWFIKIFFFEGILMSEGDEANFWLFMKLILSKALFSLQYVIFS